MPTKARTSTAFSLVELLTVLGTLAALLALLLPTVSRARAKVDDAVCIGNVRQLVIAWSLYCHDNSDMMPPNIDGLFGGFTNWVAGNMAERNDATNAQLLIDTRRSLLAPYLKSPTLFKCPSDESPHSRSVSMNCRLNPTRHVGTLPRWVGGHGRTFRTFKRLSDVDRPSEVFAVIDENDKTINDAYFVVDMSHTGNPEGQGRQTPHFMIDYPGIGHSGAAAIAFVDGHALVHRWLDAATIVNIYPQKHVAPQNPDAIWLEAHCTYE